MNQVKNILSSEYFKLFAVFLITIGIGAIFFIINSLFGLINLVLYFVQAFLGLFFGFWYFRISVAYFKELRKKETRKKVGVKTGWAIFGLITSLVNLITWGFFSGIAFNIPKIFFFVPTIFALIQIGSVLGKTNRINSKDWLLLLYNIFVSWYLFAWTLTDFSVDLPGFLGIFQHTITSAGMWLQIYFVNTTGYFVPTFLLPPILFNPRYYLAMPYQDYQRIKQRTESKETEIDKQEKEKRLPGERIPFFEERQKRKKMLEEVVAIEEEMKKTSKKEDEKYAEFVACNDFKYSYQKFIRRFSNFMRYFGLGFILVFLIVIPVAFVGNITMHLPVNYQNQNYSTNDTLSIAIEGRVFSVTRDAGFLEKNWEEQIDKEIDYALSLNMTYLRYDLTTTMVNNNESLHNLSVGVSKIKNSGLKVILNVMGNFSYSNNDYFNVVYTHAIRIAKKCQPDYMIIFNELNGQVEQSLPSDVPDETFVAKINNITEQIKYYSPTTKVMSSVLLVSSGIDSFRMLLDNNVSLDAVGLIYYPLLYTWRFHKLYDFQKIYEQTNTSKDLWISETGVETLNMGERAQSKYFSKLLALASRNETLKLDGICIKSLLDNDDYSLNEGIISHFGLIYYSGEKKEAYYAIKYALSQIKDVS